MKNTPTTILLFLLVIYNSIAPVCGALPYSQSPADPDGPAGFTARVEKSHESVFEITELA